MPQQRHRAEAAEDVRGRAVLPCGHDDEPKSLMSLTRARLGCPTESRLGIMKSPGNWAGPSRREHAPLPDCLTRLLDPQRLDAGYVAHPARSVPAGSNRRTYIGVLALIWLDLDRLGQLTELMVHPIRPA